VIVFGVLFDYLFTFLMNLSFTYLMTSLLFVVTTMESKSANEKSNDQPVGQVSSTTTTSNAESSSSTPVISEELNISSHLRKFTFNDLKLSTRNFRPESLLGEGGFGCVFKGWIEENGTAPVKPGTGLTVAVKTLNPDGLQGHKEWLVRDTSSSVSFDLITCCFLNVFLLVAIAG